MANEIHVGDVGTIFERTMVDDGVAVNIASATTMEMKFRKPDGTTVVKTAVFVTDGSEGKLKYTTIAGDLDQAGEWMLQVRVIMPTGEWRSDYGVFRVFENL